MPRRSWYLVKVLKLAYDSLHLEINHTRTHTLTSSCFQAWYWCPLWHIDAGLHQWEHTHAQTTFSPEWSSYEERVEACSCWGSWSSTEAKATSPLLLFIWFNPTHGKAIGEWNSLPQWLDMDTESSYVYVSSTQSWKKLFNIRHRRKCRLVWSTGWLVFCITGASTCWTQPSWQNEAKAIQKLKRWKS